MCLICCMGETQSDYVSTVMQLLLVSLTVCACSVCLSVYVHGCA